MKNIRKTINMKNIRNLWIVDIESIPSRYTSQWKRHVPEYLKKELMGYDFNVRTIEGKYANGDLDAGAFFKFTDTNIYKSEQVSEMASLIDTGEVNDGDYFLFTDAWHPGAINLRYMLDLNDLASCKMMGMWHAGSYDRWDFLGRKIGNKPWIRSFEESLFSVYDLNFFASNFHIEMFEEKRKATGTSKRVGWPMDYLFEGSGPEMLKFSEKENIVVFPHRRTVEKTNDSYEKFKCIFSESSEDETSPLYGWQFIETLDYCSTKREYYNLLSKAKISLSFAKQETLGISMFESLMAGCYVSVPDRLSYSEMYDDSFRKFKNDLDFNPGYVIQVLGDMIRSLRENPEKIENKIKSNLRFLRKNYFSGEALVREIINLEFNN